MKICWVNPYMESEPISAGRIQTLSIVRGLAKRGHEVYLIAHGTPKSLVDENLHLHFLKPNFFRTYPLRSMRALRHHWSGFLCLYYYFDATLPYPKIQSETKRLVSQLSCDIIHVDHLFLGRHIEFPAVLTTHNIESRLAEQTLREFSAKGWLFDKTLSRIRKTEYESAAQANHIVCVSQEDYREIKSWGVNDNKLSVIPLGINYPEQAPFPEGNKVVFVGSNFDPNRFALEHIVRRIAPKVPEACFEIVGSVCEYARNMSIPRNVKLLGRLEQQNLYKIYSNAAVAIAPLTVGSGLKMKILEYLAWGKPVIATDVAMKGFPELQDHRDVIIEHNIENFPQQIKELLSDTEMKLRLYMNSREKAKKYAFDNIVTSYENLLKRLAQKG